MREETVERVAKAQAEEFAKEIESTLHMGDGATATDTTTIGSRNYGRWEIKYPLKSPYIDPDFASNELLLACVKCMMDTRVVELETFSTVVSLPGSPTMQWHRDDRELWPRALKGENKISLPPSCNTRLLPRRRRRHDLLRSNTFFYFLTTIACDRFVVCCVCRRGQSSASPWHDRLRAAD
eukprot:COSAG06_NODE_6549_length_2886_cov_7.741374_2_plen_181_part_00